MEANMIKISNEEYIFTIRGIHDQPVDVFVNPNYHDLEELYETCQYGEVRFTINLDTSDAYLFDSSNATHMDLFINSEFRQSKRGTSHYHIISGIAGFQSPHLLRILSSDELENICKNSDAENKYSFIFNYDYSKFKKLFSNIDSYMNKVKELRRI
jgi:hypothetical protein